MRPCLVLNDFNGGGAERLVKDLAIELETLDDVSPVVVVSNERGELRSEFEESGIEYSTLGIDVSIRSVPNGVRKLTDHLRALNPDVIHSHLAFSDLISRVACMRLSLPHVSTYHNVAEKRSRLKRGVERSTRRLSDRIVCVSDGVRQSYGDDPRMCVIYNAIDVEGFNRRVAEADLTEIPDRIRSAETVYLNVGRCVEVKRQWDLVEAMKRRESSTEQLVIVGDGPLRPELEALVSEEGLSDRVTVTGFVDSVVPYFAAADVFVSSSSKEGLPTTHIEAMAAELPIVSTDIPGVREIVEDGTTGYLCPVGEAGKLAATMERAKADGQSLGSRGFETASSTFSIEKIATDHAKLYRETA